MYPSKRANKAGRVSRSRKGEALISVIVGSTFLVPIALMAIDLVVLVLVNSANDNLAHTAARAAANQKTSTTAGSAATDVVMGFHTSTIIPAVNLDGVKFTGDKVTVATSIGVYLPAPIPCVPSYITFHASDSEPVVGVPSTL